jgi:hypothetical protein
MILVDNDDYQWRYQQPAPSMAELFARAAGGRHSSRGTRRRTVVAFVGLLVLGLVIYAVGQSANAHPCLLQLSFSRLEGSCNGSEVPPPPTQAEYRSDRSGRYPCDLEMKLSSWRPMLQGQHLMRSGYVYPNELVAACPDDADRVRALAAGVVCYPSKRTRYLAPVSAESEQRERALRRDHRAK